MATFNEIYALGLSGLNAARNRAAVASLNIANADTPGYARRVLDLSTGAWPGLGVVTGDPRAIRAPLLARALNTTLGRQGFHEGRLEALQLVEEAFNDLDGVGLDSSLTAFQNALQALSAAPAGSAQRQQLLDAAESLGAAFATARLQVQGASDAAVQQAQTVAVDIGAQAQSIALLNTRIKAAAAAGQDTGLLVDQRDALLQQLSGLIDVSVVPQSDGTVRVFTNGGQPLVAAESAATVTVGSPGGPPDYAVALTFQLGDGPPVSPLQPVGGQLGGLVAAQNETLGAAVHRLDELAFAYANAFNSVHAAGVGADGSTGLAFFATPATVEGAAASFGLSDDLAGHPEKIAAATDAAGIPGGNDNLLALLDVLDQPGVLDGKSVRGALEALTFGVARAVQSAQAGVDVESASAVQLETLLQSEVGVSVDDELVALAQANAALDAAGSVIRRLEDMNDTLLSLVS